MFSRQFVEKLRSASQSPWLEMVGGRIGLNAITVIHFYSDRARTSALRRSDRRRIGAGSVHGTESKKDVFLGRYGTHCAQGT